MDIALNQRPMTNKVKATSLIGPNRLASVMVVFQHSIVLETSIGGSKRKPSGTRKEFDTAQGATLNHIFRGFFPKSGGLKRASSRSKRFLNRKRFTAPCQFSTI